MRWMPKTQRSRSLAVAVGALLAVGGIVGAVSLDSEPGDRVERPAGSADAVAGIARGTAGGAGGSVAADEFPHAAGGPQDLSGAGAGGAGTGDDGADPSISALGGEGLPTAAGQIVKEATLDVELGDEGALEGAQQRALALVRRAGGLVESSLLSDESVTMTVRIPAAKFEVVLEQLGELGEVKGRDLRGEDVSAEVVDLDARLRHWKAQEAVFLALMQDATSISETIEIRRELSSIQQTIEQIEARKRFLDDRTAFSTLTLNLLVPGGVLSSGDEGGASDLSEAWDTAWDAGASVVGGTLIVLGALIPLSVILAVPGLLVWSAVRRRRAASAGVPPAPSPTPAA